jgi:LacI family transcriptional regulator
MIVTSKEIAKITGFSRGTVDRALNNRLGINPKTKQQILKVAEDLGYKPNLIGQSLVKGKTMSLGVVVFDLENRFFSQLLTAIEYRARDYGYFTYFTAANNNPQEEISCIDHLVNRRVDGIIVYSANRGKEFNDYLSKIRIPIITVCNFVSDELPFIGIDDVQAIKDAVENLVSRGYDYILYVSPLKKKHETVILSALEQRLLGFKEAVAKMKFRWEIIDVDRAFSGDASFHEYLGNGKTAFLCANDVIALHLLNRLKKKGIQVPEDVGLMGFDNIDVLGFVTPKLATVNYPVAEVGRKAVETFMDKLAGKQIENQVYLPHDILNGSSLRLRG